MKKMVVFITIIAFVGVSAIALNSTEKENPKTANKTECATVTALSGCGAASIIMTAGAEKASGSCGTAVKTAAQSECGDKAVKTAAQGECGDKAVKTSIAEKASCGSKTATQTAEATGACCGSGGEAVTTVAENK
jgi:hypothetical protein